MSQRDANVHGAHSSPVSTRVDERAVATTRGVSVQAETMRTVGTCGGIPHLQTILPQDSMPILCNYYLTYRCNAFCDFCSFGNHENHRKSGLASTEHVLSNIAALRELRVRFIDFTGGEPLLHRDLPIILHAAKQAGLQTSITTNALLYPRMSKELKGLVDLLHFSLDSSEKAEHDRSRGVPCFDAVIESLGIARSLGETPDIIFTVTNENYRRLEGVYRIARTYGSQLLINPIFGYFRREYLNDDALEYIEDFSRKPMTYLNPSFVALRRQGGNNTAKPMCKAVSRVVVISPDNEILLPCYHLHFEKIPIRESLVDAYRNKRIAWHRVQEGRHEMCSGCTINCYFEPSFAFPVNSLAIASIPSKVRYGFNKYLKQPFLLSRTQGQPPMV